MTDDTASPTSSAPPASHRRNGAAAPVLDLRGISVTIDGRTVLRRLSWTVQRGEHWVVVGPNGGGKSTLLRVASLQLHPSSGSVTILGNELGRIDIRPLRARVGISAASLSDQLRGRLTAEEIVRCGLHGALEPWWHPYGATDTERAEDLLAQVGLAGYGPRHFATLSSGERQRVLLARTLMPEPDLVLLDEPTAGLDFGGREELVAALDALAADPAAVPSVVVTHRVEDIPTSATHLLAVAEGRVVASGEIGSTLTADVLGETFGLAVRLARVDGRWAATASLPVTSRRG